MLMDANLRLSAAQVITGTSDSTFTYDILKGNLVLTAGGTYTVPSNDTIGNASFFGEDLGRGRGVGEPVFVFSALAGTITGGTSLTVSIQGAPDNGSGAIASLAFVPYVQSEPLSTTATPPSLLGASRVASLAWPKRPPGQPLPRFIKATYTVAGANFSGLAINADVTLGPDDANGTLQQYPANF